MAYAYRQAKRALAISSSTSASTLMINIASPLMPVRSFAFFGVLVILFNYVLVVFLFPSAIILYEDKFNNVMGMCKEKIK